MQTLVVESDTPSDTTSSLGSGDLGGSGTFSFPDECAAESPPNLAENPGISENDHSAIRECLDHRLARAASSNNLLAQWDAIEILDSPVKPTTVPGYGHLFGPTPQERYEKLMHALNTVEAKLGSHKPAPTAPEHLVSHYILSIFKFSMLFLLDGIFGGTNIFMLAVYDTHPYLTCLGHCLRYPSQEATAPGSDDAAVLGEAEPSPGPRIEHFTC